MPTARDLKEWGRSEGPLILVVLIWGFNFPIIKGVLEVMPAHAMNFFRLLVSAAVLLVYYIIQNGRTGRGFLEPMRGHARPVLALGLLGYFVYQYVFIVGINHTAAGSAALIMASVPLWAAIIGHFFGLERIRFRAWSALAIILSGTAIIVLAGAKAVAFGEDVLFGNLVMVGAAILWGSYTAFNRPVLKRVMPVELALFGLLVSLPFLFVISLPHLREIDWSHTSLLTWLEIFFSGGLSTGVASVIWSASVRDKGATHTASFGNLVPFVALFSSYFLLSESISIWQIGGGALIIGGLVWMRRSRNPIPA